MTREHRQADDPDHADREYRLLARHDWECSEDLDVTLAEAFDRRFDLPMPLYPAVDTEVIAAFLRGVRRTDGDAAVRLEVDGCKIVVDSDGTITVREPAPAGGSGDRAARVGEIDETRW